MPSCDTLIRNATVFDGSGAAPAVLDVALRDGRIGEVGASLDIPAKTVVDADGLALAPGFIDVHTHDDTSVILNPAMLANLSQGFTTGIVGHGGIIASPES